jgi:hypothetical protein
MTVRVEVEAAAVEQDRVTKAGPIPIFIGPLLEGLDLRIHGLKWVFVTPRTTALMMPQR